MARIKGIDLPKNKRGVIGLTYIYGIGPSFAKDINWTTNSEWTLFPSDLEEAAPGRGREGGEGESY